jgi:hypothetical protein
MKFSKSHIQLTALVLSFVFTNTVLAAESTTNAIKDNETASTISNAGSETASPVAQTDTAATSDQLTSQPQTSDDAQSYRKQMDEHRQQAQQAQEEAYQRFLERRKENIAAFDNNIPADVQERHSKFIKQMEQRRALNVNAELTNDAGSDTASPVVQNTDSETATPVAQADTAVSGQQVSQTQTINDAQSYRQQMDERRQQAQQAQLEAYKHFLERRKENTAAFDNNIPADVQERRNEFIKQMEERRALNIKMMEQHRKASEERRAAMQLKMHRTSTTPELANDA